ncbi:hypothetical protein SH528x_003859 [Novipirellula sp. SH528]|uniref:hypothetical protein n=1 Tax=Novipirellula sp. SH528 TaxID=3454466 RepID=UPI003FA06557
MLELYIAEWSAWKGFLLPCILPDAKRIEVQPFDEAYREQFASIVPNQGIVCFQINASVLYDLPFSPSEVTKALRSPSLCFLNSSCNDITKSTLHNALDQAGLPSLKLTSHPSKVCDVIVKSNLNCGGLSESRHADVLPVDSTISRLLNKQEKPFNYNVVSSDQLPKEAYLSSSLIVERYISNPDDFFYRLYFAGSHRIAVKGHCSGVVKKICGDDRDTNVAYLESSKHDALAVLPPSVVKIGSNLPYAMGAEFGCIDIVCSRDDEAFAIDLNPTPYAGSQPPSEEILEFLRIGLLEIALSKLQET